MTSRLKVLTLEQENDPDVGITVVDNDTKIIVNAYSEWCGDTERGFGAEVSASLSIDQVKELITYLTKWLEK